jgi:hypothetical protein
VGASASASTAARPLVSVLGTCSSLVTGTYPADSQSWFDGGRNAQVVFYAHLLFPVAPLEDETVVEAPLAWHPPMAAGLTLTGGSLPEPGHYAEAEWLDPAGARVALYGLTFAARTRADWVTVAGRDYVPHTFAMAIGTRDLRADAGQLKLPNQEGQYTVRLKVDGHSVGLSFFRMLHAGPAPAQHSEGASAKTPLSPQASPTPVPSLPGLKLP